MALYVSEFTIWTGTHNFILIKLIECHLHHHLVLLSEETKKSNCAILTCAQEIRDLSLEVKRSTVKSGVLRQLTNFKCAVTKTSKWTAMCQDFSRFENLYDALTEMTNIDRSKISFDTSADFHKTSNIFFLKLMRHLNFMASHRYMVYLGTRGSRCLTKFLK